MEAYAVQAVHGVVYGMLLFLVTSGLTLVFGMMGVLNMAHAAFYMVGAYFTYSLVQWTGSFWLCLLLAPIGVGIIGAFVERVLLRKVHTFGHAHELMLTFGIFYILAEVVKWIWGTYPLTVVAPDVLNGSVPFLSATYPTYRLFILLVSVIVLFILAFIMQKTRIGIIVRAAVFDNEMVDILGVNVQLVFLGVFSIGSALAGLAGVVAAPFLSTYPGMGLEILVDAFVVIVIGGFGSVWGALLAALMIGELQSFGIMLIPELALVFQFLLMAIVLVWRPQGLFGESA
ncbi:MAG: branched-chain amino acid ABC transporter permease [Deltaproteobacteria bacterium]|nr:MAG: branched-chain amino acid ABC transporter permease [Deltaproteobacteria bacterium]